MSDVALYLGDCLQYMKEMQDKSIDLIVADLPYGTTSNKWDVVIPFESLWKEYDRILAPKGNVILFGAGLFASKLALSNEKYYRYELVWKKSKCGSPLTAKYMPMKKHENILVFGKSGAYYFPQLVEGKPYKRRFTPNKVNNMKFGINGVQTDNKGTRHPTTILDFPQKWRRQDQVHPTQKPVELLEWLIVAYCKPNGIVLDNTMGSGTTGVACKKTGMNFVGIEKEPKYYAVATQRILEVPFVSI